MPPLRPGEPDYYETENFFDEDGQLIRRKFPEGNEVRYRFGEGSRAAEGNVVEFRRVADATRGGGEDLVETMTYEPLFNQLRSKTDPRGNASGFVPPIGSATAERYTETHSFDYQEHNLPIPDAVLFGIDLSAIPRGLGDLNGDGRTDQVQGNVILNEKAAVTLLPDSKEAERRGSTTQEIRTRYHWNDAGQRTEVVDAEGNVRQYLYHPANDPDGDGVAIPGSTQTGETGYPWKKIIDAENHPDRTAETPPLQITVEVYYNERGHPIRTVNARGVVTRIERNQQDDPIKIIEGFELTKPLETGEDPLARVVEVHYDANCNIISSETDNRDSASEPLNVSIDRTYTYDILNNQVAYSQEVDESESLTWLFEFSPDEKLVAKRAPAGTWITQILDERRLPLSVTQGAGTPEASTITTAFDKNGNITVIFDAEDNDGDGEPESTTVAYDGFDRPVRVTDALGNETTREYDVASNIIRKTTMGHPANSPDAPNILLAECIWDYDEGNRRYLEYSGRWFLDDQENIINIEIKDLEDEDNDGYVAVRSEYDALCRPTFEWEDDLEVRETVYDGANRPIAKIDAIGNRLDVDYDLNGNPIQMTRTERSSGEIVPDEIFTTRYVFDQLDRVVRATDNLGQTTYLGYDRRDNLVYRADPEGEPTSDPLGLLEGEINLPGNTVRWVFDGLDRKIKQVIDLRIGGTGQGNLDTSNLFNPDGQITLNYEWDENSRLAAIIDDNNNKTSFGYDALNRRTAEIRPDGTRYDAVYDRDNNVRKVTDPNGSVITKSFDALNRVIQVDIDRAPGVEGTTRETYGYDGLSNLTSATDDNGDEGDTITSIFIYDSLSRILEEQQTIGDNTQAISRIWSGDGKKIQEIYPGGRKISYTHDAIDRVTQVADESGVISAHAWIGPGYRELLRSLGNGTSLSFLNDAKDQVTGYDDVRRKTRLRHLGPGENPEAFIDREYGFNRANKQIRETRHDDFSQVNTMLLDSFYRTVEVIYDDGDTGPKRETIQTEYTLDGVGNRRTVRALSSTAVPSSVNFQVNPLNQYSQIGETARIHSANGNLTNNGQYTCSYDYKNRLVLVSDNATGNQVASYLFDCGNRRCQKTVFDPDTGNTISETDYFYSGPQCVEEQDAATGNTLVTYQWSPEYIDSCNQFERTEHHPLGAGRFWVHCDRQHNVAAITNSDGEVVEKRFFDDFGRMYDDLKNPMSSSGVSGLEFGFQG
ncbi:MAG: hypothetical protein KJT03_09305, partial [Verrucomicrobiae bacterium]|nr:hypothetical protein [Verrucomicrobiae bacterium]